MRDKSAQPEPFDDDWDDLPAEAADGAAAARDRILNAFLEEALAGVSPPDFSARIEASLPNRRVALSERATSEPANDRVAGRPRAFSPFAMVLGLAAVAAVIGLYWVFRSAVVEGDLPVAAPNSATDQQHASPRDRRGADDAKPPQLAGAVRDAAEPIEVASDDPANPRFPIDGAPEKEAHRAANSEPPGGRFAAAEPSPDDEVIAAVDGEIRRQWQENEITPAEWATDSEWCRRAYLRIVGRIPTVEELQTFVGSAPAANASVASRLKHRERLVDDLLGLTPEGRRRYGEEYAAYWSSYWTNLLIGRTGGLEPGSLANREALQSYLHEAIAGDTPLNRLAFELIAATGSNRPGAPDYNGAVNFLLGNMQPGDKMALATSRTSRVFLGQQLQCAQCHAHGAGEIGQDAFWAMNAFFRQMAAETVSGSLSETATGPAGGDLLVKLVNRDFPGEGRQPNPRDAEIYYEDPRGALKAAWPQFIDGSKIPPSGIVAEVDRRRELATKIAASEELSRATANRLWSHFLGYGFTQPVDDMGPHHEVSHPVALETLAEQFVAHRYDLRRLSRWIALSEPFGLSSKPAASTKSPGAGQVADFTASGAPLFGRYYMRQMQPEEVYNSLLIASGRHPQDAATEDAQEAWLSQFARRLDTDDGGEINAFDGAVHQSLAIMNGPLMRQAASAEESALLSRVAGSSLSLDEKIKHLFTAAIARDPTARELEVARELCQSHAGDPSGGLQDLWWALLNSNEFILDH